MSKAKIRRLANLMRARKEAGQSPYILVLGAGASLASGCSSAGAIIEDVVKKYSDKDITQMDWNAIQREFYALWDSMSDPEKYAVIKPHVEGKEPSIGYQRLAELIKEGYFNIVFSTNYDLLLEDALFGVGMRAGREYTVLVNGRDEEEHIIRALEFPTPRVKIVKLHGDFAARIFPFTPREIFEFDDELEETLSRYLNRDIIICGHSMNDDDINRVISKEGGSIWYVNPKEPPVTSFIGKAMTFKPSTLITGEEGKFDVFFQLLYAELIGAPEEQPSAPEAIAPSETKPAVTPTPPTPAPPTPPPLPEVSAEEIESLRRQLDIYRRNLMYLEERRAAYGIDAPLNLLNQIDYMQEQIAKIEARLRELGAL